MLRSSPMSAAVVAPPSPLPTPTPRFNVQHQPRFSIFQMFSDVLLLGKGGRLVYLGPSTLALPCARAGSDGGRV